MKSSKELLTIGNVRQLFQGSSVMVDRRPRGWRLYSGGPDWAWNLHWEQRKIWQTRGLSIVWPVLGSTWQVECVRKFAALSLWWSVFRLDALAKALSVIATATWLGGWVSVTLRYCIKTAKPIGKLFRPSESPIILVFWDPCADRKFQGEPHQRGR